MKILFVCSGNTCRSPMAEAILKFILGERGDNKTQVASCGINASEGAPISFLAEQALWENAVKAGAGTARKINKELTSWADAILCMTGEIASKIKSKKAIALGALYGKDISDPYGGDIRDYRETFFDLASVCESIADDIERGVLVKKIRAARPSKAKGAKKQEN